MCNGTDIFLEVCTMWHYLSVTLVIMTTVFLELGFSAVPTIPPPPPHTERAKTARYMAHYSNWGFLSTISTQEKVSLQQISILFYIQLFL